MKKFLVCLCSIFMMASLAACSNSDAEHVSSANALIKKLASESDKKIKISEDIVLTEQIKIIGNKEIVGNGTISVTAENMKETYMVVVSDGAKLTVGGKVSLDLQNLAGGISVNKNAIFTLQDEADIKGASSKTANVLVEGTFNMNGGTVTSGYHNVICTGESTFAWNAGTVSDSEDDAIIVGEDAEITITSADARLTGVAARGLRLYGKGVIENATMTDSMDSMVKVGSKGKLTFKNGKISDAGLHGIDNAGELLITGGTIFENYNSGICNTGIFEMTGGTLMNNKNKGVLNKSGSAKIVSASVVLTGNTFAVGNEEGAYFELAKAKLMQSKTTNVYAYGGKMDIHDIVLATSGSNNIRIVAADVKIEDTEIKGVNKGGKRTMHGLLLEGGNAAVKNLMIENTTGNAIRNKGGKITGENVTIRDINNIGIGNVNQDVTGREGIIELTNVTVENVKNNNVLIEGGVCKLTNATLERCQTNNIKVSDGKLVMKNSTVNGNVEGIKNNNHAVYMVGGTFDAANVKIQNSAGAILRMNGEKALFDGKNITFRNAGTAGINQSIGTVKIDRLKTDGMKNYNVYMDKGTVSLKNATLCKTHNNNIRVIKEGNLILTNVEIQGTAAGVKEVVHGLFVSKGTTTARNLTIKNAKVAAIRVNGNAKLNLDGVNVVNPGKLGMQINAGTTVVKGLTTSGVPGNNIQMFGDGKAIIKDSTLGKNKDNSIRVADNAALNLEGVVIEGHKEGTAENAHGIYMLNEAKMTTKNLTVKNVNGAALRTVDTPKLALYDTRILDAKTYGFRFGGGTANITKLTTENVSKNNFLVETKLSDITVKDAVLCPTNNNNVRITDGVTHLENVEIQGNTGKTGNVHGLFASKGIVTAKDITINNVKASGVRVSGGDVMIDGASIVNAGDRGIFASAGTTEITGLTAADNNINAYIDGTAIATVKDTIFGATAKENIKLSGNAEFTLDHVTVNGKKDKNGYIFCAEGKKATLNDVVIDDSDKNDYVGIWLNADTCELTGKNVTVKNMQNAMIGNKGRAEIAGLNANASIQNIYVKGADITVNGAALEKTSDNNVKVGSGRLSLNDATVKGSRNGNTNGIFVLGTGKLEANKVQVQDAQTSAFRIKGNAEVVADNTTVSGGSYGINVNEQALVQLTGFMTENVKTNSIVMDGSAVVTLKDSTLGASGDVAGYAVRVNGGTAKLEGLNREAWQAGIYNKSSNLSLAGVVNAFVYNDAAVSVGALNPLTGNQLTIDWAEGKIPSNMVGIQFANEDDANASKRAVRFGGITGARYVPYVYGSQMLLNDKNQLHYMVKSYEELVSALENVEENNASDVRITITDDIVIPQTVTIKENRNIFFQDDGTARKILRADSFAPAGTRGVMFDVSANAALTFRSTGNDKNPKLTIDGNKANIKATGNWAIVNAKAGSTGVNVCEGVQFINNSSTGAGSAIRMENGSGALNIEGGLFKENSTTNIGGAVYILTSAQAMIRNATFVENQGSNGGAVYIANNSHVLIENCKFENNHATGNGGAISAEAKATDGLVVRNGIFERNRADSEGGAINVPTACGLTLADCTFTKNEAKKTGGGLATWGNDIRLGAANSFVNISGKMVVDIFHRNKSCVNVVGSLTEGSNVVINWSGNEANRIPQGTKPAIVFASADMMNASRDYISLGEDMAHTDYRLSYKQSDAKAYCVAVTKVSDFNGLKSALAGAEAGVTKNIRLTGNVTMTATLAVKANTEVVMEDDGTARTILRGTNFKKNARGVFFDVNDGATFTWQPTGTAEKPTIIIDGNKANIQPTSGNWAIIVSIGRASIINVNDGMEFINNASTGAGCVIRMQKGTLNVDGTKFKDNRVINNYGGAIWLSGSSVANIKNAVFSGNTSENRGGGALQVCNGTTANIENTVFMNNTASINGGAICVDGKGTANIIDSIFTTNEAKDGGAIYSYGNIMLTGTDKTKAKFTGNKANKGTGDGGAIYLHGGTLTGSGYEFANNEPDNIKVCEGAVNNYRE